MAKHQSILGFLLLVIVDYCVCDDLGAVNPANVVVSTALPVVGPVVNARSDYYPEHRAAAYYKNPGYYGSYGGGVKAPVPPTPLPPPPPPPGPRVDHYGAPVALPVYSYKYQVAAPPAYKGHPPTNYGHKEERNGYQTQGMYYVLLPDGRLQKVIYTVDKDSGYVAHVSYEQAAPAPTPALPPLRAPLPPPPTAVPHYSG